MKMTKSVSITIAVLALAGCSRSPEANCTDKTMAFVMSQNFVKRELKAPSSAQFPFITEVAVAQTGKCQFHITAFVDAPNSFGAMLRSYYSADMEYLPASNTWRGSNVEISE